MQLTGNSLPETARPQSVELLNQHLAAAIDLHGQLKQAHWNVRGTDCIAIHKLLDKISVHVEGSSDLIAERAGGLDGTAHGSVQTNTTGLLSEISRGIDQQLWFVGLHRVSQ
jgi:starvation-inducible DNA-binding protein